MNKNEICLINGVKFWRTLEQKRQSPLFQLLNNITAHAAPRSIYVLDIQYRLLASLRFIFSSFYTLASHFVLKIFFPVPVRILFCRPAVDP